MLNTDDMTIDEAYNTCFGNPYIVPIDKHEEAKRIIRDVIEEVKQYRELGTVEELRTATEKQIPKKPHKNFEKFSGVWCSCGKYFGKVYFVDKPIYCPDCGQKLDWSDEE